MPSKTEIKRHLINRGATGQRKILKQLVERSIQDLEFNQEYFNNDHTMREMTGVLSYFPRLQIPLFLIF